MYTPTTQPRATDLVSFDTLSINPMELIIAISHTMDMSHPGLTEHNLKVTALSEAIGRKMGLPAQTQRDLIIAAALHDMGALSNDEKLSILAFETTDDAHAEVGYQLLRLFPPFEDAALMVRHHHTPWGPEPAIRCADPAHMGSCILAFADRVAALLDSDLSLKESTAKLMAHVEARGPGYFHPAPLAAFAALPHDLELWRVLRSGGLLPYLSERVRMVPFSITGEQTVALGRLFAHLVDFQSPFTATHSAGVAHVAEALSGLFGFTPHEQLLMRTAGYLHDLGKLAVGEAIISKRALLSTAEMTDARAHALHTRACLGTISGFEPITSWAANHHERLDGSGYPLGLRGEELDLGSRLMAVADVFTACAEDRPYRAGLPLSSILRILGDQVAREKLDGAIVSTLFDHIGAINTIREQAQADAVAAYNRFRPSPHEVRNTP